MTVSRIRDKWRYDFMRNGQRYAKSGYSTKAEAKAAEAEAVKKVGTINTDFLNLCNKKLDAIQSKNSKSHYTENKKLFKNLMNLWGKKREITRDDVEEYLSEVSKDSRPKANKHLRRIKALFNFGIERSWFTVNPTSNIKPYPVKKFQKYIPPREDVIKVLELAKKMDRLYLLLVIHTLARIREVNNLKWADVHDEYLTLWTKKSANADEVPRDIPLNKVLKEVIKELPKNGEYVFMNPRKNARTDQCTKYDYRDKFLKTLCRKAGVKNFTFHCLRHFGASTLASVGAGLSDIQGLLGHSQISTTNLYVQSLKPSMIDAVKKMEEIK